MAGVRLLLLVNAYDGLVTETLGAIDAALIRLLFFVFLLVDYVVAVFLYNYVLLDIMRELAPGIQMI